jgi:hypothetical protein|tara:strand:- start:4142 stop:4486 length:345 start_codon:yes stop_codon:yes gene_type:complete
LSFNPDLDDRVDSLKVLLPVHDFLLELFDIFGRHHSHELHGVLFDKFNNFIHSSKNWILIPFFEFENLSFPNYRYVVKFGLDFGFFGCTLNKLCYFFSESMEFEVDEIIKAELW